MLTATPSEWQADIVALHALEDRVGEHESSSEWVRPSDVLPVTIGPENGALDGRSRCANEPGCRAWVVVESEHRPRALND